MRLATLDRLPPSRAINAGAISGGYKK